MAVTEEPLLNTCPSCLQIIDVSGVRPYEKISCPLCEDTIRVRTRFNHYTLKEQIGEGGMSRVFRAIDDNLGREVALKILHSQFELDEDFMAQFEREAKITASINHPNVVQVFALGRDQGYIYIAMELLQSKSLERQILDEGKIPQAEALRIILQVATGLQAAHRHGLIHRDVKPGNILLDHQGTAKLVDFGLALMQGSEEDTLSEIWATPFYVPPEKLWGRQEDFRGDIYSLGATLYHMVCGTPPHAAETNSIQELMTIKSRPLDLQSQADHLEPETVQLIERMMAYDPPLRHASYEALLKEIQVIRDKLSPRPRKSMTPYTTVGATTTVVTVLVSLAIYFVTSGPKPNELPPPIEPGNETVLSSAESEAATLLTRARADLTKGNRKSGIELLTKLANSQTARADWRAWACFQLGMEALFQQNFKAAQQHFHEAQNHALMLPQGTTDFFDRVSNGMQGDAFPPPPIPSSGASAPLHGLASLPFALKHWYQGNFAACTEHLNRFLEEPFGTESSWVSIYRERATSLARESRLLESLDALPEGDDPESLNARVAALRELRNNLATQKGIRLVGVALSDTKDKLKALAEKPTVPLSLETDLAIFNELQDQTAILCREEKFAEARSLWQEADFGSPQGKSHARIMINALQRAAAFRNEFTSKVGRIAYDGEILRKEGRSFRARLVKTTKEVLIVDLGFGPTNLSLDTVSAKGLLIIALGTFLAKEDAEELAAAALYAWFSGEKSIAKSLARRVENLQGFPLIWESVQRKTLE